jgi:hypothetical protein
MYSRDLVPANFFLFPREGAGRPNPNPWNAQEGMVGGCENPLGCGFRVMKAVRSLQEVCQDRWGLSWDKLKIQNAQTKTVSFIAVFWVIIIDVFRVYICIYSISRKPGHFSLITFGHHANGILSVCCQRNKRKLSICEQTKRTCPPLVIIQYSPLVFSAMSGDGLNNFCVISAIFLMRLI